ncbi:MAG: eukaryotic-like serine/threonine-protein kinase [Verrucomicrobiota bacterium]|jgi:serine/threonine-protein kinase
MTPAAAPRWDRVKELFEAAADLAPRERAILLDRECAGDESLRAEIESLMASDAQTDGFIETPLAEIPRDLFPDAKEESLAGRQFGAYQIIREIGRGGLGAVYLAARADDEYRKEVAIKLVRRGLDTDDILRRFRNERQILAQLDHPNIGRLIDGGTTEEGSPYFVMEYVKGEQIGAYCDAHRLTTASRLNLFRKVCAAVTYAHQNLVIHRDLKPSNILVTAEGEPKLLDFGIAKLLGPEEDALAQTSAGQQVMTPEYASPEQIRGEKITTASDVYSLGVLLYELLTGQRPYRLKTRTAAEISRAITEQEPQRPSTAVAQSDPLSSEFGPSGTGISHNPKSLRGDLDNIVLMAMRKQPTRRYASVAQFSEDIRRHLEGMPVIARKDTVRYRAGKFVRRHKVAVAAAALLLVTLFAGVFAATWEAKGARRAARLAAEERDRAVKQTARAEKVTAFLQKVLGFSDPGWASSNPKRNREATISEALVEAGRQAEVELANEPEALAAVQFTIGTTYRTQSRYPEAEPYLRASLDLRRRFLGPHHLETGQSMVALGEWNVVTGHYAEAEPLFRDAIDIFRTVSDAKWLAISLNDLGTLNWFQGKQPAAEKFLREALEVSSNFVGGDRVLRAIMYSTLGLARRDQGDLNEGGIFLEKAIEEHRALPGEPRSELALALSNLASIRLLQADYDHAEALASESFQLFLKTVGENHQYTAYPLSTLAEIYYRRENYPKAREAIERVMQIQARALPAGHTDSTRSSVTLGKILMRSGALTEAETTLRAAYEKLRSTLPSGHFVVASARGALGECLVLQQRYAEAEPLLLESHHDFEKAVGAKDPRTQDTSRRLVLLYDAWSKPDQAAPYRASLEANAKPAERRAP